MFIKYQSCSTVKNIKAKIKAKILSILSFYPLNYELDIFLRHLSLKTRLILVTKDFLFRFSYFSSPSTPEISILIYSAAGRRMLIPITQKLAQHKKKSGEEIRINITLLTNIDKEIEQSLIKYGCHIEKNPFFIFRFCRYPNNKLLLLCLDHRLTYKLHQIGIDAVDAIHKFGVRAISIQHGGTTDFSLKAMSSFASDVLLVWGEKTFRELVNQYGVSEKRLGLVGNPVYDRIPSLDRNEIIDKISRCYPNFNTNSSGKKIILLGTVLHSDYDDRENPRESYKIFMNHIFESLDFSKIFLIIKMHPTDNPQLYSELIPSELDTNSLIMIEPNNKFLDSISLIKISDLLITRASTLSEEALLMGKKVIAFDLDKKGPSKMYSHLKKYSNYRVVYAYPQNSLRQEISKALFAGTIETKPAEAEEIEKNFAYSLDGCSTDRAITSILQMFDK